MERTLMQRAGGQQLSSADRFGCAAAAGAVSALVASPTELIIIQQQVSWRGAAGNLFIKHCVCQFGIQIKCGRWQTSNATTAKCSRRFAAACIPSTCLAGGDCKLVEPLAGRTTRLKDALQSAFLSKSSDTSSSRPAVVEVL
eukprot:GHRQ01015708.1.p1 GENE.GHRQ01015708.1~~GHRQ01015708.1.p1  ORF type:complete len:142 (+),score=34.40 GHRQ01015708.1:775-1200(+)